MRLAWGDLMLGLVVVAVVVTAVSVWRRGPAEVVAAPECPALADGGR